MGMLEKKLGKALAKNVLLSQYSTFKIGGPATYFFIAKTEDDLIMAVKTASKAGVPYYILGAGANVLIADRGIDGLVILVRNDRVKVNGQTIIAGAGVSLGKLIQAAVKHNLIGIECWAGIPGTVGGSVYGNMGRPQVARGSVADWLTSVKVYRRGRELTLSNQDCQFKYRDSIFKRNDDIILSAEFHLLPAVNPANAKKLLSKYQAEKIADQPVALPSSGCIFKNPPHHSAGQLIDELGLKGKIIGGAQVSTKHANFINNLGRATAADVLILISLIKQRVREGYHLQLEEEINYLGF